VWPAANNELLDYVDGLYVESGPNGISRNPPTASYSLCKSARIAIDVADNEQCYQWTYKPKPATCHNDPAYYGQGPPVIDGCHQLTPPIQVKYDADGDAAEQASHREDVVAIALGRLTLEQRIGLLQRPGKVVALQATSTHHECDEEEAIRNTGHNKYHCSL